MLASDRKQQILTMVDDLGTVTVKELIEKFNVSSETIRNDLLDLEKKNLLIRVHGGAMSVSSNKDLEALNVRIDKNLELKQEIAELVLKVVEDGDIISIDSGSTGVEIAKKLSTRRRDLTVITNAVDVMQIIGQNKSNQVIFLGGVYSENEKACYGDLAVESLKRLHISKAFISPSAVSERGIYVTASEFYPLLKAYISAADQVYITATSNKFHAIAPILLTPLKKEYVYITNSNLSKTAFWSKYSFIN